MRPLPGKITTWPHHFLIHYQTAKGRSTVAFTPDHQYHHIVQQQRIRICMHWFEQFYAKIWTSWVIFFCMYVILVVGIDSWVAGLLDWL